MWPLDSISRSRANGYFLRDLLIFNGLKPAAYASKGFIFEPPDFNNSQIGELNDFQDQLSVLLASLSDNQRLQVQWFCDSDYQRELLRYNEETKRATNVWTRRSRNERFARYWTAMTDRQLRRQRLILYISRSDRNFAVVLRNAQGASPTTTITCSTNLSRSSRRFTKR